MSNIIDINPLIITAALGVFSYLIREYLLRIDNSTKEIVKVSMKLETVTSKLDDLNTLVNSSILRIEKIEKEIIELEKQLIVIKTKMGL